MEKKKKYENVNTELFIFYGVYSLFYVLHWFWKMKRRKKPSLCIFYNVSELYLDIQGVIFLIHLK